MSINKPEQSAKKTGFFDLPAELRIKIYEYTANTVDDAPINLCHAAPPLRALGLTNRQLYNETSSISAQTLPNYWSDTSFVIDLSSYTVTAADKARIRSFSAADVQRITKFQIIAHDSRWQPGGKTGITSLVDAANGKWSSTMTMSSRRNPRPQSWMMTIQTEIVSRGVGVLLVEQIMRSLDIYERWSGARSD